jgi:hypothetical protein
MSSAAKVIAWLCEDRSWTKFLKKCRSAIGKRQEEEEARSKQGGGIAGHAQPLRLVLVFDGPRGVWMTYGI